MAGVWGGKSLLGKYTAIQPKCMYNTNNADSPLCFSLLQAFYRTQLEEPSIEIQFLRLRGTSRYEIYSLPPSAVEQYIVYSDNTVVVYDFFEFADVSSLEEQLEELALEYNYAAIGVDLSWLLPVRDYFLKAEGGIGSFIQPIEP